ncbi:MAG: transglycosylase domain-containing protein [Gaiellaceae bacterium]
MTAKRRRRPPQRKRRRRRTGLIAAAVLVVAGFSARAVFGGGCDLRALHAAGVGRNSFVYATDGGELGVLPADRNRMPVTRAGMNPWLRNATVAIEDRRFYQHGGIDPIGIVRAFVIDLREARLAQGGSTITQELVRNLYLSRDRTLSRKLTEACLAIKLSHRWSKDRILTAYLNDVYYGNHAYGVEAAAETYFSTPARDLTLDQAALLAGLPQAPSLYDPFVRPRAALARRDEVLHALLVAHDVSQAQYAAARASRDLHLHPGPLVTSLREPHIFGYLEDLLARRYGASTVREGGLRIYTTINRSLQRAADAAITGVLDRPGDPAAAVVALDPATGAIRALAVSSPGNPGSQFDVVVSGARQPGSTFKAIALTAAVERGLDPFTVE